MTTIRKLLKNPVSLVGIVIILVFISISIFAPLIAPSEPNHNVYEIPRDGFSSTPRPPSMEHPFGTAQGQYDIFYGCVWGTRTAFLVGFLVAGSVAVIGSIIGTLAAYYGGLIDEVLMRIVDVFLGFPFLIAAMTLSAVLGRSLMNVMIALIVFGWMYYARLMRSEVLVVKRQNYVEAARALGESDLRIITKHIVLNAMYPVLVRFTMDIGSMVLWGSALSFLGVGVEIGYADWGQMVNLARNWIVGPSYDPFRYWYTIVYPGGALVLFVLAWNLVGDTFRDILDPQMRM